MSNATRLTFDELFAGIAALKQERDQLVKERDQLLETCFAARSALKFYLHKSVYLNNEYRQCCGHNEDIEAATHEVLRAAPPEVQETLGALGLWPTKEEEIE